MKIRFDTTIAAPATGAGGAIAVIRLSGPSALDIISALFTPFSGTVEMKKEKGYSVFYGYIKDKDVVIDDVILTIYRIPNSYTGEDAAEISCHASPYIQQKIMELFVSKGVIPAQPGEFTMRAFMNGRMDLSQAEAVADLIASESEAAHCLAISQLRGGLSAEIEKLRQELLSFASLIELELDFSEEDVMFADRFAMTETIIKIKDLVDRLASSFKLGNAIKKGIPVVIAGRPNVGKSSLLNVLLEEDRAIVSEIPGTTRDTIEEGLHVGGLLFRFIDTAGLRETPAGDTIETKGIERTKTKLQKADVILAVAEATDGAAGLIAFIDMVTGLTGDTGATIILVINKSDLISVEQRDSLEKDLSAQCKVPFVIISAKRSTGIEELMERLSTSVKTENLKSPQYIVTNARHYEALKNVSASLQRVLDGFRDGIPTVLLATDVRQAIYYLGLITGKITPDDILGEIFSKFCIGK
jgi:tRNA modification GTPase